MVDNVVLRESDSYITILAKQLQSQKRGNYLSRSNPLSLIDNPVRNPYPFLHSTAKKPWKSTVREGKRLLISGHGITATQIPAGTLAHEEWGGVLLTQLQLPSGVLRVASLRYSSLRQVQAAARNAAPNPTSTAHATRTRSR
jgi:hypothetical protein